MNEMQTDFQSEKLNINYLTEITKYYLLTGGTGYPLADFDYPNIPSIKQTSFIIPEISVGSAMIDMDKT